MIHSAGMTISSSSVAIFILKCQYVQLCMWIGSTSSSTSSIVERMRDGAGGKNQLRSLVGSTMLL